MKIWAFASLPTGKPMIGFFWNYFLDIIALGDFLVYLAKALMNWSLACRIFCFYKANILTTILSLDYFLFALVYRLILFQYITSFLSILAGWQADARLDLGWNSRLGAEPCSKYRDYCFASIAKKLHLPKTFGNAHLGLKAAGFSFYVFLEPCQLASL